MEIVQREGAMQITVDIPDGIAQYWEPVQSELPRLLAIGLVEVNANPTHRFLGLAEVLTFFAQRPSPQEILTLRLSDVAQAQVEELLDRNRNDGLSLLDQQVWQQYEFVEHLVRMAKAEAFSSVTVGDAVQPM
jgi:hypothetical protein